MAEGVSVHFGPENTASFHLRDGAVVKIDLRARGMTYSVSLECAGGALRDVRYDTITLVLSDPSDGDGAPSRGATLLFDMGREDEQRFGSVPRAQISFRGGRPSELLIERRTSDSAATSERICDTLPTRPLCEPGVPPPRDLEPATTLVERLRSLPTQPPPTVVYGERAEAERIRMDTYERLLARGAEAVTALADTLGDPDVNMRRKAALTFGAARRRLVVIRMRTQEARNRCRSAGFDRRDERCGFERARVVRASDRRHRGGCSRGRSGADRLARPSR
jgi:hypothetical protein